MVLKGPRLHEGWSRGSHALGVGATLRSGLGMIQTMWSDATRLVSRVTPGRLHAEAVQSVVPKPVGFMVRFVKRTGPSSALSFDGRSVLPDPPHDEVHEERQDDVGDKYDQ